MAPAPPRPRPDSPTPSSAARPPLRAPLPGFRCEHRKRAPDRRGPASGAGPWAGPDVTAEGWVETQDGGRGAGGDATAAGLALLGPRAAEVSGGRPGLGRARGRLACLGRSASAFRAPRRGAAWSGSDCGTPTPSRRRRGRFPAWRRAPRAAPRLLSPAAGAAPALASRADGVVGGHVGARRPCCRVAPGGRAASCGRAEPASVHAEPVRPDGRAPPPPLDSRRFASPPPSPPPVARPALLPLPRSFRQQTGPSSVGPRGAV